MGILIVVNNPGDWSLDTPGVEVVSARRYISDTAYSRMRGAKIFNLCKSYRYQSLGYYVSLLAEARGHKPMPSITTIQDFKSLTMMRLASDDLEELIQERLSRLQTSSFVMSIYFGRNVAKRYDRLAMRLFNMFPAPLLRAQFALQKHLWVLQSVAPISASDIPPEHQSFVVGAARDYFAGKRPGGARRTVARYDLAILYNPEEENPPSTPRTIDKFIRSAKRVGIAAEVIGKDEYGKLAEFDALFIRETTAVNHHTYRFSRRAAAEGLVVIDDPESIVRCSNKVFLAEALEQNRIRAPRTLIVNKDNIEDIPLYVGFPCVLKQPDSAFSMGVKRVSEPEDLEPMVLDFLSKSDLVIAQEFLPSSYDWRVGVLDGKPLFVAKYHMVRGHWQIAQSDGKSPRRFGRVEAVPIADTPRSVVRAAVRAAAEFGRGLYGVDVKQIGRRAFVIEVNDNPNIDAGYEDRVLGNELYDSIMRVFLTRMSALREPLGRKPAFEPVRLDLSSPVGRQPGARAASLLPYTRIL